MSDDPAQAGGMERLIAALLDGDLSVEEAERLRIVLAREPVYRAEYLRQASVQAMLLWREGAACPQGMGEVDPHAMAELLDEVREESERRKARDAADQARKGAEKAAYRRQMDAFKRQLANRRPEPIVIPWSVVYVMVGSLAAAIMVLAYYFFTPRDTSGPVALMQVAEIVDSYEAQWEEEGTSVAPGTQLTSGKHVLTSGLVGIEFDHGVKVLLEAPAELEWATTGHVSLNYGKLVGNVPREAIGFTVETPTATIVDLGTEFGIDAQMDRSTIEVFMGLVEVDRPRQGDMPQEKSQLSAGQAARVRSRVAGIERIASGQTRFARTLPSAVPSGGFQIPREYVAAVKASRPTVYWRFEDVSGGFVKNEMGDRFRGVVQGVSSSATGDGNHALQFREANPDRYVHCDEPLGRLLDKDYSVELWVNPDSYQWGTLFALVDQKNVGGGERTVHGLLIELEPEVLPEKYPFSPKRIRFCHRSPPGSSRSVGTSVFSATQYETRHWQHVVAVKEKSAMRLYLNGTLAAIGSDSTKMTPDMRILIGRLNYEDEQRGMAGELDEVAIYDRALPLTEIRAHYEWVQGDRREAD